MPETPEQKARKRIDVMLVAAGWLVQDRRRLNLHAAPGVALCETDVEGGFADYMLFVDAKAIGAFEAKAEEYSLVGVADESELYARAALTDYQRWSDPLPFTYESNGEETRFRDLRDPRSRSRFVFSVHRPETLRAWMEQPDTLRARLRTFPALDKKGQRDCQVDANLGLEKSFARQDPRALAQMATGAGKTWMAVTLTASSSSLGRIAFSFLWIEPISNPPTASASAPGVARPPPTWPDPSAKALTPTCAPPKPSKVGTALRSRLSSRPKPKCWPLRPA
jgi:type I restriction enzyme R subunit